MHLTDCFYTKILNTSQTFSRVFWFRRLVLCVPTLTFETLIASDLILTAVEKRKIKMSTSTAACKRVKYIQAAYIFNDNNNTSRNTSGIAPQ